MSGARQTDSFGSSLGVAVAPPSERRRRSSSSARGVTERGGLARRSLDGGPVALLDRRARRDPRAADADDVRAGEIGRRRVLVDAAGGAEARVGEGTGE